MENNVRRGALITVLISLIILAGAALYLLLQPGQPPQGQVTVQTPSPQSSMPSVTSSQPAAIPQASRPTGTPNVQAQAPVALTELNAPRTEVAPVALEIKLSDSGFSPQAVYVATKATVVWTNTSSRSRQIRIITNPFVSSPPFADLVSPVLQPGQSYTYRFDNSAAGVPSIGYYDTLDPSHKASVAFEQQ